MRLVSFLPTREVIHLATECVCPPIPTRKLDWQAYDDNKADADYDYESGRFIASCPIGAGETESEAIEDLFDQMEAA